MALWVLTGGGLLLWGVSLNYKIYNDHRQNMERIEQRHKAIRHLMDNQYKAQLELAYLDPRAEYERLSAEIERRERLERSRLRSIRFPTSR